MSMIGAILSWLRGRSGARLVAVDDYRTTWRDDPHTPYPATDGHVVSFYTDRSGRRWTEVATTRRSSARLHPGLLRARQEWQALGILPPGARRSPVESGEALRVIRGGKSGDAA